MQRVADLLSIEARRAVGDTADVFGRSAFNRYYYSTYLSVRELLGTLNSGWRAQSHKQIPELLEGGVRSYIRTTAKQLVKQHVLDEAQMRNLVARATRATSNMANLLRTAYSVRVVADYQPENKVVFGSNGFSLWGRSSVEASTWRQRLDAEKGALLAIAKELGLV